MTDNILDYAIIGGGITGLYSGWRLLTGNDDNLSVAVFEASNRLGGRLLSVVPPNVPGARVELGGMRFIEDAQPWTTALVKEGLKLDTTPLAADQPQNLVYVRRTLLRQFELSDANKIPYKLREDEKSKEALGNLTATAAMRALKVTIKDLLNIDIDKWQDLTPPANDGTTGGKMTEQDWKIVAEKGTYEGQQLSSLPMRYMMLRAISHEAFRMAEETSGYDSILYTWNGADGFSWNVGDYGPDVKYLHVKDGYDRVPLRVGQLYKEAGGQIRLNARLESFSREPNGNMTLAIKEDGQTRTVIARNLILAMPRRSIELLEQSGPLLDPKHEDVRELIESVTPIPLFKLAICYHTPWFQDPKIVPPVTVPGQKTPSTIEQGKSVTDLPIRQCYYWKIEPDGNCVLLIYDDGRDLDYWAGLRSHEEPFKNPTGEMFDLPDWNEFPAPQRMVDEIHRQLVEMHGADIAKVPKPYSAAYRDWGEDPYGGGANFWHVGSRSYEIGDKIIQPKKDVPAYIVGECWSHAQGWVEGSLATAEQMLQGHLGLSEPTWKTVYDRKVAKTGG